MASDLTGQEPALSIPACALLVALAGCFSRVYAKETQDEKSVPLVSARVSATPEEINYLSRLVYLECGGDRDCGLSVIATVVRRTDVLYLSDGTLRSTLSHHSGPTWQFPPSVIYPCHERAVMCPDEVNLARQRAIVGMYLAGLRGTCDGYLHYWSVAPEIQEVPALCEMEVIGRTVYFFDEW